MIDKTQLTLGDNGYIPTQDEITETVSAGKAGLREFKHSIYLIKLHEMYKEEPYSYKTVSEFVHKEFHYSRASFYRILHEIDINKLLYNSYDAQEPKVNSFICQKLVKLGAVLESDGYDDSDRINKAIKEFWYFLNSEQTEKITGALVDVYIAMFAVTGRLVSLDTFEKEGGRIKDLSNKVLLPNVIATFEKKYVQDSTLEVDKGFKDPEALNQLTPAIESELEDREGNDSGGQLDFEDDSDFDFEGDSNSDPDCDFEDGSDSDFDFEDDSYSDPDCDDGKVEEGVVENTQPIYFKLMPNIYSKKIIDVVNILRHMNQAEKLEIQNILDMALDDPDR